MISLVGWNHLEIRQNRFFLMSAHTQIMGKIAHTLIKNNDV